MGNQTGFSLLELISCLVIFSILSLIAYPAIGSWRETAKIRSEVTLLMAYMQKAKIEAISKNCYVVFQFDLSANSYSLFIDNGNNGGIPGDWFRQEGEQELVNHVLNKNVFMESTTFSGERTRFNPTIGTKTGTLVLANKSGSKFGVILSRIGRIRVERK